jgi:cellulose synthase/poly-beta-1,6-N-acetylglucosamine synthase-like glycosyltransferase
MRSTTHHVFSDPSGRRRARLIRVGVTTAVCLLALLACVVLRLTRFDALQNNGPHSTETLAQTSGAAIALQFDAHAPTMEALRGLLSQQHLSATFLVSGGQALRAPKLLQNLLDDGHQLALAPFSGQSPDVLGLPRLRTELQASQLALVATLGRRLALVHCPVGDARSMVGFSEFMADLDAAGLRCLTTAATAQARAPAVHLMLNDKIRQHPAPRSLAASLQSDLATLIDAGRMPVPLPSAMGWTDEPLHEDASPVQRIVPEAIKAMLWLFDHALAGAAWLSVAMLAVFSLRSAAVSWLIWRRAGRKAPLPEHAPDIAVIVPAFNEATVIVNTVRSLLACRYPRSFDIVVVDDGSTDPTYAVARAAFADEPRVQVLTKSNGGKCSALNLGIEYAAASVVVCIDADTQLDADALHLLCRHFSDPTVGAVAGNPKVGNRCNLMTRLQGLEYVSLNSVERQAMEGINAITCVAGAFGAYRRDLLLRLGGYTDDTLAEDTDMTLRILLDGQRITYAENAVAWTEAPETVRDFMKQRFRWVYGTMQAAFKHARLIFGRRCSGSCQLALAYLLLVQVGLGCLCLPVIDLLAVAVMVAPWAGNWSDQLLPAFHQTLSLFNQHDLLLFAMPLAISASAVLMTAVALRLDVHDRLRRLVWLVPMQLIYRVLLGITAYRSIACALVGRTVGWGTLARTGHVGTPTGAPPMLDVGLPHSARDTP